MGLPTSSLPLPSPTVHAAAGILFQKCTTVCGPSRNTYNAGLLLLTLRLHLIPTISPPSPSTLSVAGGPILTDYSTVPSTDVYIVV